MHSVRALLEPLASRGCAFGDYDNDGDVDVVINPINDYSALLQCESKTGNNWIAVRAIGTKSNRSGIGARIRIVTDQAKGEHTQLDEVRSGGNYYSQNDLRAHFGLERATKVKMIEVRWPSGMIDTIRDAAANQVIYVREGTGATSGVK